jgi:hypothetical protein
MTEVYVHAGDFVQGVRKFEQREISGRSLRAYNMIWIGPEKQTFH